MNQLNEQEKIPYSDNTKKFKFIDLFAGIGGLRKPFDELNGECVFTSEWNEKAELTYNSNFKNYHPIMGDITKIDPKNIPYYDLLLAGFPCQPFSLAGVSKKNSLGKKHGFLDETQGTLFFDVVRFISTNQPNFFLLENVKNLLTHDKGKTFKIITDVLTKELGYYITYRVINGIHYVPQNRERIYIIGSKENLNIDLNELKLPNINDGPTLKSILHGFIENEQDEPPYFVDGKVNEKYTLSDKLWNYLQQYKLKHSLKGNGFGFGLFGPEDKARTLSARYYKDGAEILIKQEGKNPRRLTPRECSRLMGFDKPNLPPFKIPVSDAQAYKQFGNSVVVPVVEKVAEFLLPYIISNESD